MSVEDRILAVVIRWAASVEPPLRSGLGVDVADQVETDRTLRENGLHVAAKWMRVAPHPSSGPATLHLGRRETCALWRTLGGAP